MFRKPAIWPLLGKLHGNEPWVKVAFAIRRAPHDTDFQLKRGRGHLFMRRWAQTVLIVIYLPRCPMAGGLHPIAWIMFRVVPPVCGLCRPAGHGFVTQSEIFRDGL